MVRLAIIVFFCLPFSGFAEPTWFNGTIVTKDHKVMNGDVFVHPSFEVIILRLKDSVLVLPAYKIASCHYYNTETGINARIIAITDYSLNRPVSKLFEVVVKGNVDVLRRPKFSSIQTHDPRDFDYYTYSNFSIHSLFSFRNSVFPNMLEKQRNKLSAYMVANHLNPNNEGDAILLIQFYNKVIRSEESELITARR